MPYMNYVIDIEKVNECLSVRERSSDIARIVKDSDCQVVVSVYVFYDVTRLLCKYCIDIKCVVDK